MPVFFYSKANGFNAVSPEKFHAPSVADLFSNLSTYLEQIPPPDRHDFYYGLAETLEPRRGDRGADGKGTWAKANWSGQEVLAWDIDGLSPEDLNREDSYIELIAEFFQCQPTEMTVVKSGHGLHFIFFLREKIKSHEFFEKNRLFYKQICDELNTRLHKAGLTGKFDTAVFDHNRIMRLPGTENRKREPWQRAQFVQVGLFRHSFALPHLLGLPDVPDSGQVRDHEMATLYRRPDVSGIVTQCSFLQWVKDKPLEVKEPQAYAAISILARLDTPEKPGRQLAKEYYAAWTNSSSLASSDPDRKIDQALAASQGRTCANINTLWSGCSSCPHFGKLNSPLGIKSEDFIASEANGFWRTPIQLDSNGNAVPGKPQPQLGDLLMAFERDNPYVYHYQQKQIWRYTGTHYVAFPDAAVKAYCESKMRPQPNAHIRNEFLEKIRANNGMHLEEWEEFTQKNILGKINLANGIYDTKTRELSPHDAGLGFRYVLPYAYDSAAKSPRFDQFLKEITLGRLDFEKVILDALASVFLPDYYQIIDAGFWWFQGEGSNGKTKLLNTARGLVGKANMITLQPSALSGDSGRFKLAELEGKLLCFVEEINDRTLDGPMLGILKHLSSGGSMLVERKGKDPFTLDNAAKFWFTANSAPVFSDTSKAIKRRIIPVPFDLNLLDPGCKVARDPKLEEKLLAELPGIFNRCMVALTELLARGEAFVPAESRAIVQGMMEDSDSVERWISQRLDPDAREDSVLFCGDAYDDYAKGVDDDKYKVSKVTFGKRLKEKLGQRGTSRTTRRGDRVDKAYHGIKLLGALMATESQF